MQPHLHLPSGPVLGRSMPLATACARPRTRTGRCTSARRTRPAACLPRSWTPGVLPPGAMLVLHASCPTPAPTDPTTCPARPPANEVRPARRVPGNTTHAPVELPAVLHWPPAPRVRTHGSFRAAGIAVPVPFPPPFPVVAVSSCRSGSQDPPRATPHLPHRSAPCTC